MITRSFSKSFSFGNRPSGAPLSSDSTVIIVGGPGEILYSGSPVSSFSQATGGPIAGYAGSLYSAGYGAGKYIIGGRSGDIFTATTLPNFTESSIPVMVTYNQNIEGMAYGNGIWVAVGSDPSRIATSLDGVTWTTRTSAVSSSGFGALIFANGCFLCTAGYGKMMRSIDGINWSLVTTGFSTDSFFNTIPALVWTGEYFVAASSDDGYAVRSVDGITWTTMNIGTGSAGFYYHAAHGDGKVTILLGNNGYYRYSSDLVTWTLAQIPGLSGGTNTICYDGQKYIVTSGSGGTVRQSIDGIVWTTPGGGWPSMGIDPNATYIRSYNFNTAKDPFYANVVSLMHFDNNFTDVKGVSWTPSSPAPTFVSGMYGSAGAIRINPSNFDFPLTPDIFNGAYFGSRDFCIEASFIISNTWTSDGRGRGIFGSWQTGSSSFGVRHIGGGTGDGGRLLINIGATNTSHPTSLTKGVRYSMALTRQGNAFTLYIDGIPNSPLIKSGSLNFSRLYIGAPTGYDALSGPLNGDIDEWRITMDTPRYTAAYTPQVGPFPDA